MSEKIWLFKADPKDYSIDDLANEPNQTTSWDGIRNYMARNLIRDEIKKGDRIVFREKLRYLQPNAFFRVSIVSPDQRKSCPTGCLPNSVP